MRGLRCPCSAYALPAIPPGKEQAKREKRAGNTGGDRCNAMRQFHGRDHVGSSRGCQYSKIQLLVLPKTRGRRGAKRSFRQIETYVADGLAI